jgi:purine-binding chemotaxis protein CheW
MRARFGRPVKPLSPDHNFIVVRAHQRLAALWIDRVNGILSFEPTALAGAEGLIVGTRSFAGILRTRDGLVVVHDPEAFITEAELDAASEATLWQ